MKRRFYVSMMCADLRNMSTTVKQLEEAKIDGFHMDVMDGVFVPNFALGLEDIKTIRSLTDYTIDAHLMVINPSQVIDIFLGLGLDIIYVHSEGDGDILPVMQKIKENHIEPGLAINPETKIAEIKHLLPYVKKLLVMTVTPGFAGQSYQEQVDQKIEELIQLKENYSYKIVVDGAISPHRISYLSQAGVDGFVLGTSSTLFKPENNYKDVIDYLHTV